MAADQALALVLTTLTGISVLVLVALGLAIIFGMMRIINLAHGEFLMIGAFVALYCGRAGVPFAASVLVAAVVVGLFGVAVERLLIQHLYGRLEDTMLATWGLSLIMVQAVVLIFGASTRGLPTPLGNVRFGRYSVSGYSLVLIAAAVVMLALVFWLFTRTRYGTMARAAMQLPETATIVGINTRTVNMVTFGMGSALAGAAGALLAPVAGVVPSMGQGYIARAFMTVIVGGPAVLTGTTAAAALLGTVDRTVSFLSTQFYGQAALLIAAIVLLRLMPTGLSGRMRRQL